MTPESLIFLPITFLLFYGVSTLQKRLGWIFLNPVLITIIALIAILSATGTEYEVYKTSGQYIEFWLKPAIVALGLPFYKQLKVIKTQFLPIFFSQLTGSVVGIASVVMIAKWLGATPEVVLSLASKSVTTPIAIEVTAQVGGIPAITSAVVICVGILGAIIGLKFLSMIHDFPLNAKGISVGTAAHAIGTAQMFTVDNRLGTFATLGLILNGIITSLITPTILVLLGII